MPVYRGRRRNTWRVTLWIRGSGQKEWIVEGTRREAKDFERLKHGELCGPSPVASRTAPTFSEFCTSAYEPHARAHLGASTWRVRKYMLAGLIEHFGALKLDAVLGAPVERFKTERLRAGIKPSSINSELRVLGRVLRWARADMRLAIPEVRIPMLRLSKRRVHVWSTAEVGRLYAALRKLSPHLLPLVEFMLNTGVRKGEAIAAEWSWIDWRAKLLRIPVTAEWRPKDKEPREVPLDELLPMLRALPRTGATVFLSTLGIPYRGFPDKTFTKAVRAAGLTGGPHTTRHTFASHFLEARPDMGLLGKLLGHSTTAVTELYAHLLPGYLDRARGAVRLLSPRRPGRSSLAIDWRPKACHVKRSACAV